MAKTGRRQRRRLECRQQVKIPGACGELAAVEVPQQAGMEPLVASRRLVPRQVILRRRMEACLPTRLTQGNLLLAMGALRRQR